MRSACAARVYRLDERIYMDLSGINCVTFDRVHALAPERHKDMVNGRRFYAQKMAAPAETPTIKCTRMCPGGRDPCGCGGVPDMTLSRKLTAGKMLLETTKQFEVMCTDVKFVRVRALVRVALIDEARRLYDSPDTAKLPKQEARCRAAWLLRGIGALSSGHVEFYVEPLKHDRGGTIHVTYDGHTRRVFSRDLELFPVNKPKPSATSTAPSSAAYSPINYWGHMEKHSRLFYAYSRLEDNTDMPQGPRKQGDIEACLDLLEEDDDGAVATALRLPIEQMNAEPPPEHFRMEPDEAALGLAIWSAVWSAAGLDKHD